MKQKLSRELNKVFIEIFLVMSVTEKTPITKKKTFLKKVTR